jgi:hypothetical protein
MKKKWFLLFSLCFLEALSAQEKPKDLVLSGERWLAKPAGYRCGVIGSTVKAPFSHRRLKVQFTKLSTDRTLDNVLITANFQEGKSHCRYSAILFAHNRNETL